MIPGKNYYLKFCKKLIQNPDHFLKQVSIFQQEYGHLLTSFNEQIHN